MIVPINKTNREYEQLASYGKENTTILDKLCALLLALSPLLQHYIGLYKNAGFTVLLAAVPILLFRFVTKLGSGRFSLRNLAAIFPLILFELYTAVDHSTAISRWAYIAFIIVVFLCIAGGCINTAYFLKYAMVVVFAATIMLIIQYISFYLFKYKLDPRPFDLLVEEDSIWEKHLYPGRKGSLYRPAGIFLEPSHLFLYGFPLLCVFLLSPGMNKWRMKRTIVITAAMLLSTSGFSLVACLGLWALYFLVYKRNGQVRHMDTRKMFTVRNLMIVFAMILIMVGVYCFIPVCRRSVSRSFTSTEGTNAVDGRIRRAMNYIKTIQGKAVWFGQANVVSTLDFNRAGFFATYIRWGLIGVLLSYWFYAQGLFILKKQYFWMSAIILVISFFTAHTHGTFYMLYFVIFLMNGYYANGAYRLSFRAGVPLAAELEE